MNSLRYRGEAAQGIRRDRLGARVSTHPMARGKQVAIVEPLESKRDELGCRVLLRYRYRTPRGTVLQASIAVAEGGAYRVGESEHESLALLSVDGKRGVLLTRSGYPLLNASDFSRARPGGEC